MRCGAGAPVDELDAALAEHGQAVALPPGGTVGGALAVGRSGVRRLGYGPDPRHAAPGPLRHRRGRRRQGRRADRQERERVRPVPAARRVARHARLHRRGDPAHAARARRSSSGSSPMPIRSSCSRGCTGRRRCCGTARRRGCCSTATPTTSRRRPRALDLRDADPPDDLPTGGRWSLPPARLRELRGTGRFVAEIGVGVVHHERRHRARRRSADRRAAPPDQARVRPDRPSQPRRRRARGRLTDAGAAVRRPAGRRCRRGARGWPSAWPPRSAFPTPTLLRVGDERHVPRRRRRRPRRPSERAGRAGDRARRRAARARRSRRRRPPVDRRVRRRRRSGGTCWEPLVDSADADRLGDGRCDGAARARTGAPPTFPTAIPCRRRRRSRGGTSTPDGRRRRRHRRRRPAPGCEAAIARNAAWRRLDGVRRRAATATSIPATW